MLRKSTQGGGFGFTLRHFIVYPPESAVHSPSKVRTGGVGTPSSEGLLLEVAFGLSGWWWGVWGAIGRRIHLPPCLGVPTRGGVSLQCPFGMRPCYTVLSHTPWAGREDAAPEHRRRRFGGCWMRVVETQRSDRTCGHWEWLKHSTRMGSGLCFAAGGVGMALPQVHCSPRGVLSSSAPLEPLAGRSCSHCKPTFGPILWFPRAGSAGMGTSPHCLGWAAGSAFTSRWALSIHRHPAAHGDGGGGIPPKPVADSRSRR